MKKIEINKIDKETVYKISKRIIKFKNREHFKLEQKIKKQINIKRKLEEKVAIKILKKKKMQKSKDKSRLEREISILKRLNHINVIKIYKITEELENYYIVMEYCENGELFNYIVAHQRLSEEETSYFFYQLINGLDYIHHKNIRKWN